MKPRIRSRQRAASAHTDAPGPIVQLWMLRILVPLGGHKACVKPHGFNDDAMAEALGLGHWVEPDDAVFESFDVSAVRAELRQLHRRAEQTASNCDVPPALQANVARLTTLVGLNRSLEENPVPTIWLSNSIRGLDPAFVRRFDMVFELPVPPKAQRERLLQQHCGSLLAPAQIARIAGAPSITPALVTQN
ncbi:MAG: hypothetical protein Fur007_08630 [Rhodoferax sp.]